MNPTYFAHIAGVVISEINNVDFLNKLKIIDGRNDGGIDGIIHLGTDKNLNSIFRLSAITKIIHLLLLDCFESLLVHY